jgi:hypothetical protein
MSFGTLLTLYVVPCVYAIMGRQHKTPVGSDRKTVPQPAE